MKKVTLETEEGDMLFAVAHEVGEELDTAQKDQDRLQDELEFSCEGMVTASKEFTNCWAVHNAACANVNRYERKTEWRSPGKSAIAERLIKQYVLK